MVSLHDKQVKDKIYILQIMFDVILLLGRQNMSYSGRGKNEVLWMLEDRTKNHGNFLEIMRLISLRCKTKRFHRTGSSMKSFFRQNATHSGRRGSLVTLLSKTTINKIVLAILSQLRKKIK
jgi:hypothetical protein